MITASFLPQGERLLELGELVEVPTWHAKDVAGKPQERTWEVCNEVVTLAIPPHPLELVGLVEPNMPWAENHFRERVSGKPLNPPPSHAEWPWASHNPEHQQDEKFSHTYPERFWPKWAESDPEEPLDKNWGIRYEYGDLDDVLNLLRISPTTRQAYLPVFFPEDTGAVHGERIPCTLGYLFPYRKQKLHITYYIRSCDFYRHFRDDVYMAARLCQWVCERTFHVGVVPGTLTMHIGSLHIFEAELPRLRREYGYDDRKTA